MGLSEGLGSLDNAEVLNREQAQGAQRDSSSPMDLTATQRWEHRETQGKALTTDVAKIKAFDNLGGDRKERDLRQCQAQHASDVVGASSCTCGTSRTRASGRKPHQTMINQASN